MLSRNSKTTSTFFFSLTDFACDYFCASSMQSRQNKIVLRIHFTCLLGRFKYWRFIKCFDTALTMTQTQLQRIHLRASPNETPKMYMIISTFYHFEKQTTWREREKPEPRAHKSLLNQCHSCSSFPSDIGEQWAKAVSSPQHSWIGRPKPMASIVAARDLAALFIMRAHSCALSIQRQRCCARHFYWIIK